MVERGFINCTQENKDSEWMRYKRGGERGGDQRFVDNTLKPKENPISCRLYPVKILLEFGNSLLSFSFINWTQG